MSSLLRRQQRKLIRGRANYSPQPRPFKYHPDGGYSVLRPTKGWMHVSAARLRAQRRLAQMREAIDKRMGR